MSGKRVCVMAIWILLISIIPSLGNDTSTELVIGKTLEGTLSGGKAQSFLVSATAGDFVQIGLDPQGKQVVVLTYEPSGSKFRGGRVGPELEKLGFVAEHAGRYRVEVSCEEKNVEGKFAIRLEKIVTLAARLGPLQPLYRSPRISTLRAAVESGKEGSVETFWQEIKKEGAPIIEPLPGDDKNMLVTFLWRGAADTRNVLVAWLPHAGGTPDEFFMERLGETDVWYKTFAVGRKLRFTYTLAPNVPRIHAVSLGVDNDAIAMMEAAARPDPLNPKRWRVDPGSIDGVEYQGSSLVEMPDAPAQPWIMERPGVAAGQIEKQQFRSTLLKNEREIAVYLPPGYSKTGKPYPVLVLFDEEAYLGDGNHATLVPTPTILNNLIAGRRIPPMVAVLVGNAPGARDRELPCNAAFADFLVSELLPWARGRYNVSSEPRNVVVAGSSFGGLAATCAALRHPGTFGNVVSQSGSFWWAPSKSDDSLDARSDSQTNWITKQFIDRPKLSLRFYLDAGSEEIDVSGNGHSILLTSQNLRDVLLAKGYEVHFREFAGGHDYLSWRGTLADGLILLMGSDAGNGTTGGEW